MINIIVLSNCINEDHISDNDRKSLEHHCGRTGVIQVLNNQHLRIEVFGDVRQSKLKPCKQGRIIQCPLWCGLKTLGQEYKKSWNANKKGMTVITLWSLEVDGIISVSILQLVLLWGNTSWYHFDTDRECVTASQFRWTSKSVEWLENKKFRQITNSHICIYENLQCNKQKKDM